MQKGVILVISLFIMAVLLSIVFVVSSILYSEIKLIGSMGNSVAAFFAADSGIEKSIYYDRKILPAGGNRGMCNICNSCPSTGSDPSLTCQCNPLPFGSDCDPASCTNCEINFSTVFGEAIYNVRAVIQPESQSLINMVLRSFGNYKNVKRAIEATSQNELSQPPPP